MAWDSVAELPEAVTANPVWVGGSLALLHSCGALTYTALQQQVAAYDRCDDLTAAEQQLHQALRQQVDEFNRMWEF